MFCGRDVVLGSQPSFKVTGSLALAGSWRGDIPISVEIVGSFFNHFLRKLSRYTCKNMNNMSIVQ